MKKRYETTKLFKLEVGDRFYFASDKNMKVNEVISYCSKSRNIRADNEIHPRPIKIDKTVVFLRNSQKNENI